MSELSINTTQNVKINFIAATPGERMGAYFIDLGIKISYVIVVLLIVFSWLNLGQALDSLNGVKVWVMEGRFHFYEGYTMEEVTFPVRVMKFLGVNKLMVSNASGGVNAAYKVGSIVIIKDHINFTPEHPLRGKNDERFGPRFVNMSEPYSRKMIIKAKEIASRLNIEIHDGIYFGLQGPTFETLAEYKMVKILGADCVGMSTVPEVIVARHMDVETFGISVITDMGNEESIDTISHDEVLEAAKMAEPKVRALIKNLILEY